MADQQVLGGVTVEVGGNIVPLVQAFAEARKMADDFSSTVSSGMGASTTATMDKMAAAANSGGAAMRQMATAGAAAGAAMASMARDSNVATAAIERGKLEFDALRASLDPSFAAAERFRQVQTQVAAAVANGSTSQQVANTVLEQARAKYMGVMTAAERDAAAQNAAANAAREEATALAATKTRLDQYAAAADPVYRLQLKIAEGEKLIAEAKAAGLDIPASAIESLNTYRMGMDRLTKSMGTTRAAFRLNRIGMMELQAAGINSFQALAAGMDPFHVAMMESSQVVGAFVQGTEGGIRGLVSAIGGTLMGPVGIAIAGVTALGAGALYMSGAFEKAAPTIKQVTEEVSALGSTVGSIQSSLKTASSGVSELATKFGIGAEEARKLALAMANMEIFKAQSQIVQIAADMNGNLKNLVSYYDKFQERSKNVYSSVDMQRMNLRQVQREIEKINSEYGLTIVQATKVVDALRMMKDTSSPENMAKGALQMAAALREAEQNGQKIPEKMRDVAMQAAQAAIEALKLQGNIKQADDLAKVFSDLDMGKGIRGATKDAIALAQKLGISLGLAEKLALIQSRTPAQNLIAAKIASGAIPNVPSAHAAAGETIAPTFINKPFVDMPPMPTKTSTHKANGHKTPMVDPTGAFTEQKAYDQVIKDTTSDMKNYQLMIDATQKALNNHAITSEQATRETAMLKQKMLEATDAGKFFSQTMQSFESSFSSAMVNWQSGTSILGNLANALANVAMKFAEAAAQAAFFGTGPLSGGGTIASPSKSLFGGMIAGIAGGGGGTAGGGLGGFVSKLFGFASGTPSAPGGNAIVGENGIEIVAGPKVGYLPKGAQVIPNSKAAGMIAAPQKVAPPVVKNKIINVFDPSIIGDFLSTNEGEQVVMNIIRRNKGVSV